MVSIDYKILPNRSIIAIDVKSFFASVEAVKLGLHPLYAYLIVLSGQDRPGGIVLASSPLVKAEFGIKTGSRNFEIPKNSKLQIVEPRMALYLKVNGLIIDILKRYVADEDLLIYSIDEMILDVTSCEAIFGDVEIIAKRIQKEIWDELKLVTTIGIGPNPLMAKLCMDIEAKKSEACFARWTYKDVPTKLQKISPMTDFWGIGHRTKKRLYNLGITSIESLAKTDVRLLKKYLGVMGEELFYHAHGVDYSILSERYTPKTRSYGTSQILAKDYLNQSEIEIVIREMADTVAIRLRKQNKRASLLKLTIGFSKHSGKQGFNHQMPIKLTNSTKVIADSSISLFRKYYLNEPVRSIAISCGKVENKEFQQLSLFDNPTQLIANEKLDFTIDKIRERYGFTSLFHASSLLEGGTAIKRSSYVGGHQG